MAKKKKSLYKSFFQFIAFLVYTIPFALISIGTAVQYLITKLWRVVISLARLGWYLFSLQNKQLVRSIRPVKRSLWHFNRSANRFLALISKRCKRSVKRIFLFLLFLIPRQWRYFLAGAGSMFFFVFLPYQGYSFLQSLPNPTLLTDRQIPVTTKIFDRHGELLYELYVDENRTPVPLSDIPLVAKQATIAIEDQSFYNHAGISPRGIARALWETLVNKNLQGGSTITQQLIKSALLTPELSVTRKVKEILLAFWAERLYSKDQILEMYLNQVPYGGTSYGIAAASKAYFGKEVKDLTLAEASLLAGLPAAPTIYSPFGQYPELTKVRQNEVLRKMVDSGFITASEAQNARRQPLVFARQNTPIKAPHFVMYVREALVNRYGLRVLEQGGLRVTTTLDLTTQNMVQAAVTSEVEKLAPLLVGNGAAMVVDPKNGEILAMVGSKNYFDTASSGNVNVALALRQPGSSIKVVTYALALENGFTAVSILDDSPVTYVGSNGVPYQPVNYDSRYHGRIPLRYALANSYNVPAVKVLARLGVNAMIEKGRRMGIKSWTDPSRFGLSLTLGGGEVSMLDMMSVYATLANGGRRVEITPILKVTNYRGDELDGEPPQPIQAVSAEVAFILSDILSDNQARSAAFGPTSTLVVPGKTVAVKTGTSNEKRDNLTYGYTPSYVVGVWVGNNDNRPMHPTLTSGITGAAPIWREIMVKLLDGKADEKPAVPANVVALPCYGNRAEYFIRGSAPRGGCAQLAPLVTPRHASVAPTP